MRLFWKLFITLGVAMTVAMVAAVSMGWHFGRLTLEQFFDFGIVNREAVVNRAHSALITGGRDELASWLRTNQTPVTGWTLYIVDENEQDLLDRELPRDVRWLLNPRRFIEENYDSDGRNPLNDGGRDGGRRGNGRDNGRANNWRYSDFAAPRNRIAPTFTDVIIGPNDEVFRPVFFTTSNITVFDIVNLPATRLGVVTIAVVIAATTALLLAKSLSSPIVRLQRATRGLAAGALDTRVGSPFNQRRDEIGTLARDFDTMAERVQELITDKEVLLRDVSHELRSPLARINVALALAQRKASDSAQGDLERIGQETERLDLLVGQILTLARLRSSSLEHDVDVDLNEVVREVVADARFEHHDTRIDFEERPVPGIHGHAAELASAIENVLRNALMHSGSDVEVAVSATQTEVLVTIADHGPGVPEEDLKRLFEPFYRVDPSRDHKQSGYGLGLAIAASIIERHGGTVEACNRPGGGLAVSFRLPAGRAS
jgi:signal transduction histidine kinase